MTASPDAAVTRDNDFNGQALALLRETWGELYEIWVEDDRWLARRHDCLFRVAAEEPESLNLLLRKDWAAEVGL